MGGPGQIVTVVEVLVKEAVLVAVDGNAQEGVVDTVVDACPIAAGVEAAAAWPSQLGGSHTALAVVIWIDVGFIDVSVAVVVEAIAADVGAEFLASGTHPGVTLTHDTGVRMAQAGRPVGYDRTYAALAAMTNRIGDTPQITAAGRPVDNRYQSQQRINLVALGERPAGLALRLLTPLKGEQTEFITLGVAAGFAMTNRRFALGPSLGGQTDDLHNALNLLDIPENDLAQAGEVTWATLAQWFQLWVCESSAVSDEVLIELAVAINVDQYRAPEVVHAVIEAGAVAFVVEAASTGLGIILAPRAANAAWVPVAIHLVYLPIAVIVDAVEADVFTQCTRHRIASRWVIIAPHHELVLRLMAGAPRASAGGHCAEHDVIWRTRVTVVVNAVAGCLERLAQTQASTAMTSAEVSAGFAQITGGSVGNCHGDQFAQPVLGITLSKPAGVEVLGAMHTTRALHADTCLAGVAKTTTVVVRARGAVGEGSRRQLAGPAVGIALRESTAVKVLRAVDAALTLHADACLAGVAKTTGIAVVAGGPVIDCC